MRHGLRDLRGRLTPSAFTGCEPDDRTTSDQFLAVRGERRRVRVAAHGSRVVATSMAVTSGKLHHRRQSTPATMTGVRWGISRHEIKQRVKACVGPSNREGRRFRYAGEISRHTLDDGLDPVRPPFRPRTLPASAA